MQLQGGHNEKTLEKLWNDYFVEVCAKFDTNEERELAKNAVEMHEAVNKLLTKEQSGAVEKYVDSLCELQNSSVKKAFFKGCEFAASFLIEAWRFGKG